MVKQLILSLLLLVNATFAADSFDIESGKAQAIPRSGSWTLLAAHGRVLAQGEGEVALNLPELETNTRLDAVLAIGERRSEVRIWSPRQLGGFAADFRGADALRKKLAARGLGSVERGGEVKIMVSDRFEPDCAAPLLLVFPTRREFPFPIGKGYDKVLLSLGGGKLGLVFDDRTRMIDVNGSGGYVELRAGSRRTVVFSPDFDFEKITNILLLKQLIEGKER